ncbi:ankyrin-1-like [Uloborus diversus]|uniref:ankyrin-1-like n=1 Tax=Uloborus diversus TaxID=327109 RepID=UPI00240A67C6|nr:ankyrin-1-like [Uloborus diversus]
MYCPQNIDKPKSKSRRGRSKGPGNETKEASRSSSATSGKHRRERPKKGMGKAGDVVSQLKQENAALQEQLAKMARKLKFARLKRAFRKTNCKLLVTCAGSNHTSGNSGQASMDHTCPFRKRSKSMNCSEIWELLSEDETSDPSEVDSYGRTELHRAAADGDTEMVSRLLERGWDPRARDHRGMTPFHRALFLGKVDAAEILADANGITDSRGEITNDPLYYAAGEGYVGIVRKLLKWGADTRLQDFLGQTPLHNALFMKREDVAEILADADGENDISDEDGCTPLHYAAGNGYVEVVKKLLWSGAHPHPLNWVGWPPLLMALLNEHDVVVEVIIAACALRGVAINWEEIKLSTRQILHCVGHLSRCEAEIRRMKITRVGGSRVSYWDVARRNVSEVSLYLGNEAVRKALQISHITKTMFPIYSDQITYVVEEADKWKALVPLWLECFSLVAREMPPTCTDLVLLHLSKRDLRNFICACKK